MALTSPLLNPPHPRKKKKGKEENVTSVSARALPDLCNLQGKHPGVMSVKLQAQWGALPLTATPNSNTCSPRGTHAGTAAADFGVSHPKTRIDIKLFFFFFFREGCPAGYVGGAR